MSFLKIVINRRNLDYLGVSTWAVNAEDLLTIFGLVDGGRIGRLDFFVSQVLMENYKIEFGMMKDFYRTHQDKGRVAVFLNHCKMLLMRGGGFHCVVMSSSNLNTNPRWEQAVVIQGRDVFDFYAGYFKDVRTIERKDFDNGFVF